MPLPPITPGTISPLYLQDQLQTDAPVILEVGANDGSHTLAFLKLFPNARIFAIEPDPRAFDKLKTNVAGKRVSIFEMAIGAADGEAEFHVSSGLPPNLPPEDQAYYAQGWDQSGSLKSPKAHKTIWPWCKFENTIVVPVKRLDTWVRENGLDRIDLIWADTQGAEGDLIAGGNRALANTRFFYTEYSNEEWYEGQPSLMQLVDLLSGFRIVQRYSMDVLFKNRTL